MVVEMEREGVWELGEGWLVVRRGRRRGMRSGGRCILEWVGRPFSVNGLDGRGCGFIYRSSEAAI